MIAACAPEGLACSGSCACAEAHDGRLVVLTGGPGAGKTAVLETLRKTLCAHVAVLPEAASVLFGGGFPRHERETARRAAQRAIFHVQTELERALVDEAGPAVVLCDRGTLDGLAYWPRADEESFLRELGTTRATELSRYAAVIHLRTPPPDRYQTGTNVLRIESAETAAAIDDRIVQAWAGHPRRSFVDSATDFLDKLARAVDLVRRELPSCCASHPVPRQA